MAPAHADIVYMATLRTAQGVTSVDRPTKPKPEKKAARRRAVQILKLPNLDTSRRHSFLVKPVAKRPAKAMTGQLVLGYPDEWLTFLAFVDSVALYARRGVWAPAYPTANDLAAIIIDFVSRRKRTQRLCSVSAGPSAGKIPTASTRSIRGVRRTRRTLSVGVSYA